MIEDLIRLFDHLRWADERTLESLQRAAAPPADALEIYAHVLAAEHVWLARVHGRAAGLAVWPQLDLPGCAELARENFREYQRLLGRLQESDLRREVAYQNSAGEPFRSTVADILLHVALHGSYHRGQVALLLRRAGLEPVPTDYIAFVRGAPAATSRAPAAGGKMRPPIS